MKGTNAVAALPCFGLAALPALAQETRVRESPDEIRRKDAEWAANAQLALRKELASSPCAERLRELTKSDPLIVEVILMDARGANVCISRETSDCYSVLVKDGETKAGALTLTLRVRKDRVTSGGGA